MKFSYTALTRDNKKITGVLDMEDLDAARAELHKMGLAVITVAEISDEEYEKLQKEQEAQKVEKGINTYKFLAVDANGKEVEGTIDSMDAYSAYKRLRIEYKLKVSDLHLPTATEQEIEQAKAGLEAFESQMQLDQEALKKEAKEEEEGEERINKELIAEIDSVIVNAKKILEAHSDLFSQDLLKEIKNTLGSLELIRTSNNIKHITEVSNELYELISNPDKVGEGEEITDEAYRATVNQMEDSALVRKEFELYKKAIEVTGVKKVFKNIADKLKAMTEAKEGDKGKPPSAITKIKAKIHNALENATKKKLKKAKIVKKERKPKSGIGLLFEKMGAYFSAKSPVLKRARKKELVKTFKSIFK